MSQLPNFMDRRRALAELMEAIHMESGPDELIAAIREARPVGHMHSVRIAETGAGATPRSPEVRTALHHACRAKHELEKQAGACSLSLAYDHVLEIISELSE